jgi:hypothetical protein
MYTSLKANIPVNFVNGDMGEARSAVEEDE